MCMTTATLDKSILRTVGYFSLFEYPLTAFEIWKWLLVEEGEGAVRYGTVTERLQASAFLKQHVGQEQGFFGLGDVAAQTTERNQRLHDAIRKYNRLERALKFLRRLPWIDGIAVCNSLAWMNTRQDSDIDLFIIATPGRTWSARLLATLPLRLLRARPGEAAEDPICVSFFAAPSAFDFSTLKIGEQDPYLAYWSRSLVPLVDRTGWSKAFTNANGWVRKVLPHAWTVDRANRFRKQSPHRLPWLPFSEKLARAMQLERFPQVIKERMNHDTCVVVNDQMLKFHHNDARAELVAGLEGKMATFGL